MPNNVAVMFPGLPVFDEVLLRDRILSLAHKFLHSPKSKENPVSSQSA